MTIALWGLDHLVLPDLSERSKQKLFETRVGLFFDMLQASCELNEGQLIDIRFRVLRSSLVKKPPVPSSSSFAGSVALQAARST